MIKVTIIEDHPDFREGLAHLLNATEGFDCIDVFERAGYHPVLAENQWSLINIAYGLKIKEDDRETD